MPRLSMILLAGALLTAAFSVQACVGTIASTAIGTTAKIGGAAVGATGHVAGATVRAVRGSGSDRAQN